jgi:hypothetical protein
MPRFDHESVNGETSIEFIEGERLHDVSHINVQFRFFALRLMHFELVDDHLAILFCLLNQLNLVITFFSVNYLVNFEHSIYSRS